MCTAGNNALSPLERRSGQDRRKRPKLPPLFITFGRRRKSGRRSSDRDGYVDLYDFRTWAVALSVLVLSSLDAILTSLEISAERAEEMNPLMKHVLHAGGSHVFFALKVAVTSLALAVIILHRDFAIGKVAARFCLWSYILVAIYHLCLVFLWPQVIGD